ncbi:MAG: CotH kinase family protein [Clostridia bacterium]|nr:CotH kinase family protein [Clostridia bacterium]
MKKYPKAIVSVLLIIAMLLPLTTSIAAENSEDRVSAGLIQTNSELPTLNIYSDADLDNTIYQSKDNKVDASAAISGAEDPKHNLDESYVELKTRGNTTWGVMKWAYQIKFDSKVDLFDMGKAKKWILLANYYDGTFVRNKVMFDLGKEIGIPYVVESVFVNLYINGEYRGVYQLTEKVELGSSRIDINSDYGVLLEMDATNRPAELAKEIYFQTKTTGKPFVYKEYNTDLEDPDDPELAAEVMAYTENFINTFEAELYSEDADWDTIASMIDVDSFVRFYFITELSMEVDATYSSSYFYLDGPGDVLHCGPLWDYDRIMGWDTSYDQTTNADYLKNITDATDEYRVEWFKMLFRHPEFVARVNEMYDETIREAFKTEKVVKMFRDYQELLKPALIRNHQKYQLVFHNRSYIVEDVFSGTMWEQIEFTTNTLIDWLTERNQYLETAYGKYHPTLLYSTYDGTSGAQPAYSGGSMTYSSSNITGLNMSIENSQFDGEIKYALSKNRETTEFVSGGETAKLSDNSRFTGILVRLTGNLSKHFDVEYRVYRNGSWSSWKSNGDRAGSATGSAYVERIQARLVQKKDVENVTVSFVSTVGTSPEPVTMIAGNTITFEPLEVEGYEFGGWYANPEFSGEPLTSINPSSDMTFYAKMTLKMLGDVDGNGNINAVDLFHLNLFVKQIVTPTDAQYAAADVNGDEKVTALDLFEFKYRIARGTWRS